MLPTDPTYFLGTKKLTPLIHYRTQQQQQQQQQNQKQPGNPDSEGLGPQAQPMPHLTQKLGRKHIKHQPKNIGMIFTPCLELLKVKHDNFKKTLLATSIYIYFIHISYIRFSACWNQHLPPQKKMPNAISYTYIIYLFFQHVFQHLPPRKKQQHNATKKMRLSSKTNVGASALIRHSSNVRRCKVQAVGKACPSAVVWQEARLEKLKDVSLWQRQQETCWKQNSHLFQVDAFWHHLSWTGMFKKTYTFMWQAVHHETKWFQPSYVYIYIICIITGFWWTVLNYISIYPEYRYFKKH